MYDTCTSACPYSIYMHECCCVLFIQSFSKHKHPSHISPNLGVHLRVAPTRTIATTTSLDLPKVAPTRTISTTTSLELPRVAPTRTIATAHLNKQLYKPKNNNVPQQLYCLAPCTDNTCELKTAGTHNHAQLPNQKMPSYGQDPFS